MSQAARQARRLNGPTDEMAQDIRPAKPTLAGRSQLRAGLPRGSGSKATHLCFHAVRGLVCAADDDRLSLYSVRRLLASVRHHHKPGSDVHTRSVGSSSTGSIVSVLHHAYCDGFVVVYADGAAELRDSGLALLAQWVPHDGDAVITCAAIEGEVRARRRHVAAAARRAQGGRQVPQTRNNTRSSPPLLSPFPSLPSAAARRRSWPRRTAPRWCSRRRAAERRAAAERKRW